MKNDIIIFGASGHAKVIIDILEKQNIYKILGVMDIGLAKGSKFFGYDILGSEDDLLRDSSFSTINGVVAVGDNFIRSKIIKKIQTIRPEFNFINAIHPSVVIGRDVKLGVGNVVMAGSVINPCSKIGSNCIINTNSSIDHDNNIGNFVTIAPGAVLGGNVRVDEFSAISIGATVKHGITIGANSIIGAGSLVLEDIPDNVVAYGVPAKVIRSRKLGDKYL